jgi:hypothetical protein
MLRRISSCGSSSPRRSRSRCVSLKRDPRQSSNATNTPRTIEKMRRSMVTLQSNYVHYIAVKKGVGVYYCVRFQLGQNKRAASYSPLVAQDTLYAATRLGQCRVAAGQQLRSLSVIHKLWG